MADAPETRVSDAEREAAADRLRTAGGEGRLTLEELGDRLGQAYGATTAGELEPLTADLPVRPAAPPATPARRWGISLIGGADRKGRWRVPRRGVWITLIGGPDLDLREATLEDDDTELTIITLIGGGDIIAPSSVSVELSGVTLIGGDDVKREGDPPPPGAPVVRVRSFGLIGGTDVKDRGRR
ncbi:MAG: DUF1707 domain-containing protein [Solirubrobacteraceae bacterium]